MAGAARLGCAGVNPREVACVAARGARGHVHLVIANLTASPVSIRLDLPDATRGPLQAVVIDEVSLPGGQPMPLRMSAAERIALRPFACVLATTND
jgi:hypothetical protein